MNYFSKIASMEINANLAILSACSTSWTPDNQSGTVLDLARAFRYAGTQLTLISHWNLETNTAKKFISDFSLELYKNPNSKSEALQKTMQKMRKDIRLSHPIFWAPFELVGREL